MPEDPRLVPENRNVHVHAKPFRREDVDYTSVNWTCPVSGIRRVESIPVDFLVTFFAPFNLGEIREFDEERERWLRRTAEGYGD